MSSAERELPTLLAVPAAGRLGIPEVYAGIALLSFLVARFVPILQIHYPCPLRLFTGHPCGTCGMTHAFVYLAHGHPLQALRWSPLGTVLAAGAWAYAAADLARVAMGRPFPALPASVVRRWVVAAAGALLVNWAYLLVFGVGD